MNVYHSITKTSLMMFSVVMLMFPVLAYSQSSTDKLSIGSGEKAKAEKAKEDKENDDGTRKFAGLRFGVGLSLTTNSSNRSQVQAAEIVSGLTRVTFERNSIARIMLESHYLFTPEPKRGHLFNVKNGNWGIGPFVAIQPGSEEIIDAIGAGFMIGFKRADSQKDSWNFGFGLVVDPNVQVLGDGFSENAAPPNGETQVRFKQTSSTSLLLLTSFSF